MSRGFEKRVKPQVDITGAIAAVRGVEELARPVEIEPGIEAEPAEWTEYVNSAKGRAVEAVLEWGRRISACHAAYKAQPQRWGQTWDEYCKQNLGIGKMHAYRLQTIGENLSLAELPILPAGTEQLHALAKVKRDNPQVFENAVTTGRIHPNLSRAEALTLLKFDENESPLTAESEGYSDFVRWRATFIMHEDNMGLLKTLAKQKKCRPEDLASQILEDALNDMNPLTVDVVAIS